MPGLQGEQQQKMDTSNRPQVTGVDQCEDVEVFKEEPANSPSPTNNPNTDCKMASTPPSERERLKSNSSENEASRKYSPKYSLSEKGSFKISSVQQEEENMDDEITDMKNAVISEIKDTVDGSLKNGEDKQEPNINGKSSKKRSISEDRSGADLAKAAKLTEENILVSETFKAFVDATEFKDIVNKFKHLCQILQLDARKDHRKIYRTLKAEVHTSSQLVHTMWKCLDKRVSQEEYMHGQISMGTRVLLIGAGPCGLRMAIECALLGAHVVLIEARDYLSRNNVLHLWSFVINDIKNIGAKVFYPSFCGGNREHVSIKVFQAMLLKLALVLGVEVHAPVTYNSITEPTKKRGWGVKVSPSGHHVETYNFDVIIGADGKRNSFTEFTRNVFRGSRAIGITANITNENTAEEKSVEEIGGLTYVYNQEFFDKLKNEGGINLENFVYFKDVTHYFVMTARKDSLLSKGVLNEDFPDTPQLLARDNINHNSLLDYLREAIDRATNSKLGQRPFAKTEKGKEDVAIFDFTALQQAENSCMVKEKDGHRLLVTIIGDTLIEPFWPTGSGIARGFLSVYDTAWMIRSWCMGLKSVLEIIAEKESHYSVLSQTTVDNVNRDHSSIKPVGRYYMLKFRTVKPETVEQYYEMSEPLKKVAKRKEDESDKPWSLTSPQVQEEFLAMKTVKWYQRQLDRFQESVNVNVWDMSSSWRNGLALCAVLTKHRPKLIDVRKLEPENYTENVKMAFEVIEKEYGIKPPMKPEELVEAKVANPKAMSSYLTKLKDQIDKETPVSDITKILDEDKLEEKSVPNGWEKFGASRNDGNYRSVRFSDKSIKVSQPKQNKGTEKLRANQALEETPTKKKKIDDKDVKAGKEGEEDEPSPGFFTRWFSKRKKKDKTKQGNSEEAAELLVEKNKAPSNMSKKDISKGELLHDTEKKKKKVETERTKVEIEIIETDELQRKGKNEPIISNDDSDEQLGFFTRLFSRRRKKERPKINKEKEEGKVLIEEEEKMNVSVVDDPNYFRRTKSDPEAVMRRKRLQQYDKRMQEIERGFRPTHETPKKDDAKGKQQHQDEAEELKAEEVEPVRNFKRRFTLFGRLKSSKRQKKSILDEENNFAVDKQRPLSEPPQTMGRRVGTLERLQESGAVKNRISAWESGSQMPSTSDEKKADAQSHETNASREDVGSKSSEDGFACNIL